MCMLRMRICISTTFLLVFALTVGELSYGKDSQVDNFDFLKDANIMTNATVEGIVLDVSPMKKGHTSPYFDAKLTDEDG